MIAQQKEEEEKERIRREEEERKRLEEQRKREEEERKKREGKFLIPILLTYFHPISKPIGYRGKFINHKSYNIFEVHLGASIIFLQDKP
mgnify:CR=1 FL=1